MGAHRLLLLLVGSAAAWLPGPFADAAPSSRAGAGDLPASSQRPSAGDRSFGYKGAWIATRGISPDILARALGLTHVVPATWTDGLLHSYDPDRQAARTFPTLQAAEEAEFAFPETKHVFVTPPVKGWTLAVGQRLAFFRNFAFRKVPADRAPERLIPFLEDLSRRAGVVQYYFTHRVPETHVWVAAENGRIVRAYGCSGGDAWLDVGAPTRAEGRLGLKLSSGSPDLVSEDTVMAVAARWSVDPTRIGEIPGVEALGLLGILP